MHRLSKAYRFAAALVALSLSLGIVLPMVQHVCAMEHTAAMTHAAQAMRRCDHHSTPSSAQAAAPGTSVVDAQAARSEAPCCLVGPVSPRAEMPALLPTAPQPIMVPLPVLSAVLSAPDDDGATERLLFSEPAPSAPASLHVLYATFLN